MRIPALLHPGQRGPVRERAGRSSPNDSDLEKVRNRAVVYAAAPFFSDWGRRMRVTLEFELSPTLHAELQEAAKESRIGPSAWSAQVIEAELAARRLPHVELGRCGAQLGKD